MCSRKTIYAIAKCLVLFFFLVAFEKAMPSGLKLRTSITVVILYLTVINVMSLFSFYNTDANNIKLF